VFTRYSLGRDENAGRVLWREALKISAEDTPKIHSMNQDSFAQNGRGEQVYHLALRSFIHRAAATSAYTAFRARDPPETVPALVFRIGLGWGPRSDTSVAGRPGGVEG